MSANRVSVVDYKIVIRRRKAGVNRRNRGEKNNV